MIKITKIVRNTTKLVLQNTAGENLGNWSKGLAGEWVFFPTYAAMYTPAQLGEILQAQEIEDGRLHEDSV